MNATTAIGTTGTAVLSVDSLAAVIHWLAVHYQVQPLPDDLESKAAAVLFLATAGTVIGGIWWIVQAIARKWMRDHQLLEETNGKVVNP
jgi:hypothetical protein